MSSNRELRRNKQRVCELLSKGIAKIYERNVRYIIVVKTLCSILPIEVCKIPQANNGKEVCSVGCACSLRPPSSEHNRALRVLEKYEAATGRSHVCLPKINEERLLDLAHWLRENYSPAYASRLLKVVKTAARKQGANVPSHLISIDLARLIPSEVLSQLSPIERTACRHYAQFLRETRGITEWLLIDKELFQAFQAWLRDKDGLGDGQRRHITSALSRAATKGLAVVSWSGKVSSKHSRELPHLSYSLQRLLDLYIDYLRTRWSPSTTRSFLKRYEREAANFLALVAERKAESVDIADLFDLERIDHWLRTRQTEKGIILAVRSVTGLLRFCANQSTQMDSEVLERCVTFIQSVLRGPRKNSSALSESLLATELGRLGAEYAERLRLHGFLRKSVQFRGYLRAFLKWCSNRSPAITKPSQFTVVVLEEYGQHVGSSHRTSPASARQHLMQIEHFCTWLYHRGHSPVPGESVFPRVGRLQMRSRALNEDDTRRLLRVIRDYPAPETLKKRDLALVVLALTTGARAAELRRLTFDDVDLENGSIVYRTAKGRGRRVPLPEVAIRVLRGYLEVRPKAASPAEEKFVFLGGASPFGRALDRKAIFARLRIYSKQAGLQGGRGTFHSLRHTFASMLATDRVDADYIRVLLGHSSLATSSGYMRGDYSTPLSDMATFVQLVGDRCGSD